MRLRSIALSWMAVVVPFLASAPVLASSLAVSIEIPSLQVAEYHRPYVAVWIESSAGKTTNLTVWYQLEDEGEQWLKDMRQWWRRIGRETDMPVDGVSGATKAAGKHQLTFEVGKAPLGDLPAGNYTLLVETVREVGGRELVKIPFSWPVKAAEQKKSAGTVELGQVDLTLNP